MDRLEKSTGNDNEGFIKTVFPFDENQKALLLNIAQYTVLAIIPIVLLLKLIKNYIPEVDDEKGSVIILVEVVGQAMAMFISLYFIHKIICYIPTYSEKSYGDVNIINIIPTLLLLSITMQSKLGEKVQILVERAWELYEGQTGTPAKNQNNQSQGQVRVTQPLSDQYVGNANVNTSIALQPQMTNNKSQTNEYSIPQVPQQREPDFNNMYAGPETPLVNAASPMMEPMAANDFLGGSSFGSSF